MWGVYIYIYIYLREQWTQSCSNGTTIELTKQDGCTLCCHDINDTLFQSTVVDAGFGNVDWIGTRMTLSMIMTRPMDDKTTHFLASVLAGVLDAASVVITGGKRIPSCVLKVEVCKEADENTAWMARWPICFMLYIQWVSYERKKTKEWSNLPEIGVGIRIVVLA